jgi:hypothetical protein
LRGWRPISAALSSPVPLLFVRGRKTSLINHWASRPIYNRRSIRESMGVVNSIPSKNISIRLAIPLPVDFRSNVTGSDALPQCSIRLTHPTRGISSNGHERTWEWQNSSFSATNRPKLMQTRSLLSQNIVFWGLSSAAALPLNPVGRFSIAHYVFRSSFTTSINATKLIAP